MTRLFPTVIFAVLLAVPAPAVVRAQAAGLTYDQAQQRFRGMNEVHIAKCDRNGDGLIDAGEMPCVQGIYQVMYVER